MTMDKSFDEIDGHLLAVVFTFLKMNRLVFVAPSIRVSREIGNEMLGRGRKGVGMGGEREDTGFPGAADEVLMIGSRQHQLSQLHA